MKQTIKGCLIMVGSIAVLSLLIEYSFADSLDLENCMLDGPSSVVTVQHKEKRYVGDYSIPAREEMLGEGLTLSTATSDRKKRYRYDPSAPSVTVMLGEGIIMAD